MHDPEKDLSTRLPRKSVTPSSSFLLPDFLPPLLLSSLDRSVHLVPPICTSNRIGGRPYILIAMSSLSPSPEPVPKKRRRSAPSIQTAKKRELDRIAQKKSRDRARNRVLELEDKINRLQSDDKQKQIADLIRTVEVLRKENERLKVMTEKIKCLTQAADSKEANQGTFWNPIASIRPRDVEADICDSTRRFLPEESQHPRESQKQSLGNIPRPEHGPQ
jgi:hypothetical protein